MSTDDERDRPRLHKPAKCVGVLVAIHAAFCGVGAITGVPAPGALRRYSTAELEDLAASINGQPDVRSDCDLTRAHPKVHVDLVRSRVVVDEKRGAMSKVLTREQQQMLIGGPLWPAVPCEIS